jgi:GNAT superfamily N-acetyltransferase
MLLVHPHYRGRGIGGALLRHCLEYLSEAGIRCVKLDATPLGKPLYAQLGFVHEWSLNRWENPNFDMSEDSVSLPIKPLDHAEMETLADFDAKAFGVSRKRMLALLSSRSARSFTYFSASGRIEGYGFLREGALASYLGPVVADSRDIARALILRLLAHRTRQKVYWDIPNPNSAAVSLAKEFRFTPQRALFRMFRGTNENPGDPQRQFAIADPATG